MKRIDRNPERFEAIRLYEMIARKQGLSLADASSQEAFLKELSQSLTQSKSNPIVVHGQRIESMFEHVAASLGRCVFIKREDTGEVCSTDAGIVPPDYRLVLDNGKEILVEVKNCHKEDPNYRYKMKATYVQALEAYARVFGRDLFIALFWSRWKKWTLLRSDDFVGTNGTRSISFLEAIPLNRMAMLGDMEIGTAPPLALRIMADPSKPRSLNASGTGTLTIGGVELYCNGQCIEDEYERKLAFYFMLYSNWSTDGPHAEIVNNEVIYFEYISEPQELTPNQGFECLGSLSDMVSRHYNDLTTSGTEVTRLSPSTNPGTLGVLIPADYRGKHLPLWRFILSPK